MHSCVLFLTQCKEHRGKKQKDMNSPEDLYFKSNYSETAKNCKNEWLEHQYFVLHVCHIVLVLTNRSVKLSSGIISKVKDKTYFELSELFFFPEIYKHTITHYGFSL